MHLSQHKSCTGETGLALEVTCYLDFHWVTRPWRRTLTNGSDVNDVFPWCPIMVVLYFNLRSPDVHAGKNSLHETLRELKVNEIPRDMKRKLLRLLQAQRDKKLARANGAHGVGQEDFPRDDLERGVYAGHETGPRRTGPAVVGARRTGAGQRSRAERSSWGGPRGAAGTGRNGGDAPERIEAWSEKDGTQGRYRWFLFAVCLFVLFCVFFFWFARGNWQGGGKLAGGVGESDMGVGNWKEWGRIIVQGNYSSLQLQLCLSWGKSTRTEEGQPSRRPPAPSIHYHPLRGLSDLSHPCFLVLFRR